MGTYFQNLSSDEITSKNLESEVFVKVWENLENFGNI